MAVGTRTWVRSPVLDGRKVGLAVLLAAVLAVGPAVSAVGIIKSRAWRSAALLLDPAPGLPRVERQGSPVGCGPAVLATLLRWAGTPIPLAQVMAEAELRADGITLAEFARLAQRHGLHGTWYEVPLVDLDRLPLPFVAHLRSSGGHFVIVRELDRRFALVADPAKGLVIEARSSLARAFTGRAFLLSGRDGPS